MSRLARRGAYALALGWFLLCCPGLVYAAPSPAASVPSFAVAASQAQAALMNAFYAGDGTWRECNRADCRSSDSDWGADAATYALYLRWLTTHDPSIAQTM